MLKLKEKYQKEVIPEMIKRFNYKNSMAVPKIEKVVVNTGFGRLVGGKTSEEQKKIYEAIASDIALIVGQKPNLTVAKKAIAAFKTRQGSVIGVAVTLRGKRMYDFLDRLINIGLPRTRDFQGINPNSFDKNGNLTIGIKEHIAFPEISLEKTRTIFGLEIIIAVNSKKKEESIELLKLMGFPIKK
jgi:large subunit ribosomal protein L5